MAHSTATRSKQKATKKPKAERPDKPAPDFPLFPHRNGYWAKKIRGKLHYFGKWSEDLMGQAALQLFRYQEHDLRQGRKPRVDEDVYSVADLCNEYLEDMERAVDEGRITQRHFYDLHATCKRIVDFFGRSRAVEDLGPDDFKALRKLLAQNRGPTTLGNEVQRVRVVFNYAYKEGKIVRQVPFGIEFRRPPKKLVRRNRREKGKRMLEADELRSVLEASKQPMTAMILLAANGGLGQSDLASLPLSVLQQAVETGWYDLPRQKTEIDRRFPLWDQTREACREAIENRPRPAGKEERELAFLTRCGRKWVRSNIKVDKGPDGKEKKGTERLIIQDAVGREFAKILTSLGLKRLGLNFYCLRHGFETIAGEAKDRDAKEMIMGHADASMAAAYREGVSDERLRAVTDYVHRWLFARGDGESASRPGAAAKSNGPQPGDRAA